MLKIGIASFGVLVSINVFCANISLAEYIKVSKIANEATLYYESSKVRPLGDGQVSFKMKLVSIGGKLSRGASYITRDGILNCYTGKVFRKYDKYYNSTGKEISRYYFTDIDKLDDVRNNVIYNGLSRAICSGDISRRMPSMDDYRPE